MVPVLSMTVKDAIQVEVQAVVVVNDKKVVLVAPRRISWLEAFDGRDRGIRAVVFMVNGQRVSQGTSRDTHGGGARGAGNMR